jgi:chromosome segregation ATPase
MPHRASGGISLDYYALYDAVKAEFEHVRMLGQAPFVGYVVADFAPEGTPEPSLDTAFLPNGAEEPELFIAVASQQPVELEAFAVVQLPYRSIVSGASESEAVRRPRSADKEARAKLAALEGELALERQAAVDKDVELLSRRDAVAARDAQLREAETRVTAREMELREAEKRATARDAELREAETRVFARDAELAALRQELENKNHQLKAQEASLGELSAKLKSGPSPEEAAAAAAELTSLEKTLAERGEHIRQLERDLREAERVGKELLRQLPPAVDPAEAAKKMAETELARQLAKSQADLVATRWALDAATKRTASGAENA